VEDEFDEAVDYETDPEIDEQAPIEMVGSVARGWWQVGDEDEEIEQVADEDGGELLEEAGEHSFRNSVEDGASRV
jgi:tRNA nucleotidyltransferase (CCA-adding enzyme)